jgi:hypothetical protein
MALFGVGGVAVVSLLVVGFLALIGRFIDTRPYLAVSLVVWGVSTGLLAGVV